MAFKDLLVVVDDSRNCATRVGVAADLAEAWDAHLTGVYVVQPPDIPPMVAADMSSVALENVNRHLAQAAAAAQKLFGERTAGRKLRTEWREGRADAAGFVDLSARYSDLVIAGQADPSGDDYGTRPDFVADLIMDGMRPVLLVPYAASGERPGARVLVAWNESLEATRAVHAAMPVLETAQHVDLLAIDPAESAAGGEFPTTELARHLERHGVKAEPRHAFTKGENAGRKILEVAAEQKSDLVVMGAWGHSRLRELVLGGATRHVLRHMSVPVLMYR